MKTQLLAAIATVACIGCAPAFRDVSNTKPRIASTAAFGFVAVAIREAPEENTAACNNCNGTGRTGDGRIVITCPVCKGTGKREAPKNEIVLKEADALPQPQPQATVKQNSATVESKVITVYTLPRCNACKQWLEVEAPRWRQMGFIVQTQEERSGIEVPWFQIQDNEINKSAGLPLTWDIYTKWKEKTYEKYRN